MIQFLCPNGHRIQCPAERAGQAAKCPRCGVKFRIPDVSESESPDSAAADSEPSRPDATDAATSEVPEDSLQGMSVEESQIEFLCPNGHRLHGAASLQGRPGECPECGSKFRIPTYDDVSDEEQTDVEIGVGRADGGGESATALPLVDEVQELVEHDATEEGPEVAPSVAGHPLGRIFRKLWAEKPAGATVELHLSNGETVVPEQFSPALSRESHGLFAMGESGGTHTLTVVAWDSIVQVVIRGVGELPEGMSD